MNTRRMASRRLEEERINEEIPTRVEHVEQVPEGGKGVQGAHGAQMPSQGYRIPNVEGGIQVPEMFNKEI